MPQQPCSAAADQPDSTESDAPSCGDVDGAAADARGTRSAGVVIIGNEVLSGRVRDCNLAMIAGKLATHGIYIREARVVPDLDAEIAAAVNACRARYDYVLTTGGIGPTHDDITAEGVARAFGVVLVRHPEAVRRLEAHYPPGTLTEARLRMAQIPEGADLIDNPISAAPGFRIGSVHVLAGVPDIAAAMMDALLPSLQGGPTLLSCVVSCDLGEGRVAAGLAAVQTRFPQVEIGSYPYFRGNSYGTSVVLRSVREDRLAAAMQAVELAIAAAGGRAKRIGGDLC